MKVYLDANVFKFSATKLLRRFPKDCLINWGGRTQVVTVKELGYVNPNDFIPNPVLKDEANLLPRVADLAKIGRISVMTSFETVFETWRMRDMDSDGGRFYDAPIVHCKPPFEYGRVLGGFRQDSRQMQVDFLARIRNERFLAIQKAVGAYQGTEKRNANQLLDAFALWCAEFNKCEAFLSLDFKLAEMALRDSKNRVLVKILRPSELIKLVDERNIRVP